MALRLLLLLLLLTCICGGDIPPGCSVVVNSELLPTVACPPTTKTPVCSVVKDGSNPTVACPPAFIQTVLTPTSSPVLTTVLTLTQQGSLTVITSTILATIAPTTTTLLATLATEIYPPPENPAIPPPRTSFNAPRSKPSATGKLANGKNNGKALWKTIVPAVLGPLIGIAVFGSIWMFGRKWFWKKYGAKFGRHQE